MSDESWRGCAIFKTSNRSCETSIVSWHLTNTDCINFAIIIGAIHSKYWQTKSLTTVHNYSWHAIDVVFFFGYASHLSHVSIVIDIFFFYLFINFYFENRPEAMNLLIDLAHKNRKQSCDSYSTGSSVQSSSASPRRLRRNNNKVNSSDNNTNSYSENSTTKSMYFISIYKNYVHFFHFFFLISIKVSMCKIKRTQWQHNRRFVPIRKHQQYLRGHLLIRPWKQNHNNRVTVQC